VLDGDPAPPKRGSASQFSARVRIVAKRLYASAYNFEVGLSLGDIMLDGDQYPLR